jgi:nitrite reductase/ring-hydroxylating ferredoxin subunit
MTDWQDVAARDQLDPDFPLGVDVAGQKIGIYVLGEQVHAIADICPHAYALLSQGFVENGVIECPLHGAQFDIATGKGLTDICDEDVACFPVRVQDGRVFIQIVPA